MAFVLGVVEPYMTGLGAVGEAVVLTPEGTCTVLDAAARAPIAAAWDTRQLLPAPSDIPANDYPWPLITGAENKVGARAVAAPQLVNGLGLLHARFGRLQWAELVEPAVVEAARGATYDFMTGALVATNAEWLARDPLGAHLYLPGGLPRAAQIIADVERVYNPDLVESLREVRDRGADAVSDGWIADCVLDTVTSQGGFLVREDLAPSAELLDDVQPHGRFRDWSLYCSPRPSGGVSVAHILRLLSASETPADAGSSIRFARLLGACSAAVSARAFLSGNTTEEDVRKLLTAENIAGLDHDVTTHSQSTTCLAVVDDEGLSVSLTMTLLSYFGAKISVARAGFFLNNGVGWFDPRPGYPQSLIPGARALASVAPVVAYGPQGERIAIGGLGGRQIATAVATALQNAIEFGDSLDLAVNRPRINTDGKTMHVDRRIPEHLWTEIAGTGRPILPFTYSPISNANARLTAAGVLGEPRRFETGVDARAASVGSFGSHYGYPSERDVSGRR